MLEFWKQLEGSSINEAYPLDRLLGSTERSAAYLTRIGGTDARATVKLVMADADSVERQLSYWKAASRLSHPHLVSLLGFGETKAGGKDLLFVTMEHADEVLSEVLRDRALAPDEAGDMLEPCAEALEYLHLKGLAHGRLCPSNIVAVNDKLKITVDRVGPSGEYLNSAAADMRALGATVVEVLTQQRPTLPNDGSAPVLPDLPAPYGEIASGCLQPRPERRWKAGQVLDCVREGTPPAPPAEPSRKVLRYAVMATVGVAVLAAVQLTSALFQSDPAATPAAAMPEVSEPASKEPVAVDEPPPAKRSEPVAAVAAKPAPAPAPIAPPPAPKPVDNRPSPLAEPVKPPEPEQPRRQTEAVPPGAVVSRNLPDVAPEALRTITGTVRVTIRMSVDEAGNVSNAAIESRGTSRYFSDLALRAARDWKFAGGNPGDYSVRFEFTTGGITATPISRRPA